MGGGLRSFRAQSRNEVKIVKALLKEKGGADGAVLEGGVAGEVSAAVS